MVIEDLKQLKEKLTVKKELIWDNLTLEKRNIIENFSENYKTFLNEAKTEREVVNKAIKKLEENSFKDYKKGLKKGDNFYWAHQGKMLGIFKQGSQNPEEGFNLIVAHGDSPRLDLKPSCVYEDSDLGFLKTNLYGGLKKYQWVTRPLALWGFCALKDGRTVKICFGEDEKEPVLNIVDLLPHLDAKVQRNKKINEAIPAENLNVLSASIPIGGKDESDRLKLAILKILNSRWGIVEEDLISSEIEIVPAGKARDVGLDASMIGGYGQDDRIAVYTMLEAILNCQNNKRPLLAIIYDREEIGSYGSTGASTNFIEHLAAAAFEACGLEPNWAKVQRAVLNTSALSADVEGALDPNYKEVHDTLNAAKIGYGPCLIRYTGGAGKGGASEAGAEFMAKIRRAFSENNILWQNSLLGKQEQGGGGTVALYLAAHGLNIADCGPALLSMHSPFEISSKADLYMTALAYEAFYTAYM